MKIYHERCPKCGTWNYNLDLEETGGTYECEGCRQVIESETYHMDLSEIPVFDLADPIDRLRLANFGKKDMPEFQFRKLRTTN